MSKERLQQLRDKKRLADLRAKAVQSAPIEETRSDFSYRDSPEFRAAAGEEYDEMISTKKATLAGLSRGISFGGSEEAFAAIDTVGDLAKDIGEQAMSNGVLNVDVNLANIQENYTDHLEGRQRAMDDLEEKHPTAFFTGDIAGTILSSFATGGMGGLTAKTIGKTLGANILGGAAHGIGRMEGSLAEDLTIEEVLERGVIGAGVGGGGLIVGGAIGKVAEKSITGTMKAGRYLTDKMAGSTFLTYLGAHAGKARSEIIEQMTKANRTVGEYAERMTNYKLHKIDLETGLPITERLVKPGRTTAELKNLVLNEQHKLQEEIGTHLSKVNSKVDPYRLVNRLKEVALKKAKIYKDIEHKETIDAFLKKQHQNFFRTIKKKDDIEIIPLDLNLTDVAGFRHSWNVLAKSKETKAPLNGIYEGMATEASKIIDDVLLAKGGHEAVKAYKVANRSYGDMASTWKVINEAQKEGATDNIVRSFFNNYINRGSIAVTAIGAATALDLKDAAIVGLALGGIARSSHLNVMATKSLMKVSQALRANPDLYNKGAQELIAAYAKSSKEGHDRLTLLSAQVDLKDNPLERTSEGTLRQRGSILTIANSIDEKVANKLRIAIDQKKFDQIGQIMSTLAEQDKDNVIQPGIGWDGVAYSDQDKAFVLEKVNGIKNTRKRMHLKSQFLKDSVIPQDILEGGDGQEPDKFFNYEKARKGPSNNKF